MVQNSIYTLQPFILLLVLCLFIKDTFFVLGVVYPSSKYSRSGQNHWSNECLASADERHRKKIVRLGVILPFKGPYEYRMDLVKPAIEYARDSILHETGLLQKYTVELEYRDSNCSETQAPLEAIDMYTARSADAFIGPVCKYSLAPIARFSYKFGIPVLTAGALVDEFSNKSEYELLTRMLGEYTKVGDFLVSALREFKFRNVGMLLHSPDKEKSDCWFKMNDIYKVIRKSLNPDIDDDVVKVFDENRNYDFTKYLKTLSKKCRGEIPKHY